MAPPAAHLFTHPSTHPPIHSCHTNARPLSATVIPQVFADAHASLPITTVSTSRNTLQEHSRPRRRFGCRGEPNSASLPPVINLRRHIPPEPLLSFLACLLPRLTLYLLTPRFQPIPARFFLLLLLILHHHLFLSAVMVLVSCCDPSIRREQATPPPPRLREAQLVITQKTASLPYKLLPYKENRE